MKTKDFITEIGKSELYNLGWVNDLSGELEPNRKTTVISFINEALIALYDKFTLKRDQLFVELIEGKTSYKLSSEHQMDSSMTPDWEHYIWKSEGKKFNDNLIKIEEIFDTAGNNIPLNDDGNPLSVFTPEYNVIQLPLFDKRMELSVSYIASPDKIVSEEDNIILPSVLYPALSAYVAYKAYNMINTAEATQTSVKYMQKYSSVITDVVLSDNANQGYTTDRDKFIKRGWI